ncbi:beta-ketoacyl synthase chain length factor [Arenimonas sp.]|uniref:beta-ketoacyl synthase chain length factor n=1 Tax=Arenimonas sp. TaxID=1872635 RepID=UPI0039E6FFA2
MQGKFSINHWSAFAAGLESREDWLIWAKNPRLPAGEATPPLAEMPAMQRRRVERLGRMALQVAWWCQEAADAELPLVFASRHGDLARTYQMLRELAAEQPLSPTHFGLSTHNAIAAQYSIARMLTGNYLCVSAGVATAEAGVVESLGLLADGAREVLLVVYDDPVPSAYAEYVAEAQCGFAWAARLQCATAGMPSFSLTTNGATSAAAGCSTLPHGLDVLRFFLSDEDSLRLDEGNRRWCWRRHA